MIFSTASLIHSLFAPAKSKVSSRGRRPKGSPSRRLNRMPQSGWIVSPQAEKLEDRTLLSSINLTATTIEYTSSSGNQLVVTDEPSFYRFFDTEEFTVSVDGVPTGGSGSDILIPITGITSISINMTGTDSRAVIGIAGNETLAGGLTVTADRVSVDDMILTANFTIVTANGAEVTSLALTGNLSITDGSVTTIGDLDLTGDLTVTANAVTFESGTVASDATVTIESAGAITSENDPGVTDISAIDLVMTTTGLTSHIGVQSHPILTSIVSLTAVTNDGGIYVSDVDANGLIISNVLAKEGGFAPTVNGSNQVVVRNNPANGDTTTGTFDVEISALGDILLATVTAPDVVAINSSNGEIQDLNQSLSNLLGQEVNLSAGQSVGQQPDPIELSSESVFALTTNGSIYLAEGIVGTLASIVAGGTDQDVEVTGSGSSLSLGIISADGDVTVTAESGQLVDDNGDISGEKVLLIGKSGIGTSSNPLETLASAIDATARDAGAGIFINETDALNSVAVKTNDGDVTINFTGGLTFAKSTDLLNASGAAVTFETTGGGVKLGLVDAGSNDISIKAFGSIQDDASDATVDLRGGTVTLIAGTGIGASGSKVTTDVASLSATTTSGNIQIVEDNSLSLSATAGTGTINVTALAGDLTLTSVKTSGQVDLTSNGAILDGNGNTLNVSGASLSLNATNGIGRPGDAIETSVSSLSADSGLVGVFLANKEALTLNSASTVVGDVSVTTVGNLVLHQVSAANGSATVSATGRVTDGNGADFNVFAASATLKGATIGEPSNKIETIAPAITVTTTAGGIYLSSTGIASLALAATAAGQNADLDIDSDGNIVLDVAIAQGDLVNLVAAGAITDGNDIGDIHPVNIVAKSLKISAPNGIGTLDNPLELSVDQILGYDGGNDPAPFTNDGPLAISEEALEASGTGNLVFDADTITILDMSDDHAGVAIDRSVVFRTLTGHIVFNDPNDTIQTQGTGSITVQAGTAFGSGGVAVLGNLKTAGQDITVTADRHITIGLLDAGTTGNVRVESRAGLIVDGNGAELNVIGFDANLSGAIPTVRQFEFDEITKVADAAGKRGEAAAKQSSYDSFFAALVIATNANDQAEATRDEAQIADDEANAAADAQNAIVHNLELSALTLSGVELALGIAADIFGIIAGVAQAVPFTGDGGTATANALLTIAADVVSAAIYAIDVATFIEAEKADELSGIATAADEELAASEHTLFLATETKNAFSEAVSISLAAYIKAAIARDAAARVSEQATLALEQANVMSTPDQALGIQVTGVATLTAPNSEILLEVDGSATINAGSLFLSEGDPDAIKLAASGVTWTLTTNESIGSLEGVAGTIVFLGNHTLRTGKNDTSTHFAGVIHSNDGVLIKEGTGTFSLDGMNDFAPATTVSRGRLDVNGTTSAVTVENTATLGGTGAVFGNVIVKAGGTVSPGNSPGVLRTATVTFESGSTFAVDIDGTTAGNGESRYDQMVVTGNNRITTLGGAELSFNMTTPPAVGSGQVYKIIDSTGTGSTIRGTFKYHGFTLNQGDVFTVDSTIFRINYNPTNGKGDVTLTEIPAETLASLGEDGVLTITDVGRASNDHLTLSLDTSGTSDTSDDYVLIHDPKNGIAGTGGVTSGRVLYSALNRIIVNSGIGANTLRVDFTNGNPLPLNPGGDIVGLHYNAGDAGGTDSLLLTNLGIPFETVFYHPSVPVEFGESAFVLISESGQHVILTVEGVESATLDGTQADNLVFIMPETNDTVALTDLTGASGVGMERFTASGLLALNFSVAGIDKLVVSGGGGNDNLKVNSLDPAFLGEISLFGDSGNDVIDATGSKKTVGRVTTGVNTYQVGGEGNDKLTGGIGNDTLDGGEGNDTVKGGAGNDAILGGTGNDQLLGDAGNDTIAGGADNDSILGGAGEDVLAGQGGSDTVKGEAGSDLIAGGSGSEPDSGDVVTDLAIDINETLILVFNDADKLFEISAVV